LIKFIQSNSKHPSGIGIVGFCERTEMLEFVGSFAEDHRQNKHFRSEQNKAHRIEIISNSEKSRFNNNTTALIFGSFHQGKEQRFHFKPISPHLYLINSK
jgi:hypothetical protein